ncbi:MAG: DNA polymerase/3'-5' exonuclease PolX [Verrucomicrobia bacterium]|nr:DNA polymerase/3'-5' exonuclease PolX [Verrucomicrobiota bacterium]MBU4366786.1 DNA polymerase/3'-5' exonuclease PolX [Verrucomicrobiota bacterium]
MPVHNVEIAAKLSKLADLLEIEGANAFRVRAYRNAARLVESLARSVADMVAANEDLSELPGIGEALARKLKEIVETGHLAALEQEEKQVPAALSDLMKIPGLGPRRVHELFEKLKITDLASLKHAVREGKLQALDGFGEKTETRIREHLNRKTQTMNRMLLVTAEQVVESLLKTLRGVKGVKRVVPAGSFRRRLETVGDVDILATCADSAEIMRQFVGYEDVAEVIAHGATRSSVILRSGLHVDLRVVPEECYGAALHYFTGSKAHNIAIRARGVKAGLKINEYGVFHGEERVGGATEPEVYAAVQLPYIEPELREDRGEIEAAEKGQLPKLVVLADIRGDLQSHSTATDGKAGIAEMAKAARKRGYEYLAITDHSKRMTMVHGLNATRLARQIREIDRLNVKLSGFRILKSIEVDILENGELDLADDILKELDVVVGAVHSLFALSREKQTERIMRAMDNPCFHIFAHPSGRLIGERDAYEVDLERLFSAAKERGCFMELNAHPMRLDLNDTYCRMARELGVKIAISTDSHNLLSLDFMRLGVSQARRGWLEKGDVLNTRPWSALQKLLKRDG